MSRRNCNGRYDKLVTSLKNTSNSCPLCNEIVDNLSTHIKKSERCYKVFASWKRNFKKEDITNETSYQNSLSEEDSVESVSTVYYTCCICKKRCMKSEELMYHLQNNPSCFVLLLSHD